MLGFHTGFCKAGLARYPKSELDGASDDPDVRFENDFFLDIIFSPVTAESASQDAAAAAAPAGAGDHGADTAPPSAESTAAQVHAANAAALAEANYWQRLTKFNPPGMAGSSETVLNRLDNAGTAFVEQL